MSIRFGVTFLPEALAAFADWVRCAEDVGFELIGIADSQSLYRELYVASTLCALHTSTVKFGPRVTNPLTRHPAVTASAMASLEELAPGRTLLGVGTGDSALAAIGEESMSLQSLREYVAAVNTLWSRGSTRYRDKPLTLSWARPTIPVYIAAHGPKTLRLAGQMADGIVVGTGLLPEVVEDSLHQIRLGAQEAGRTVAEIDVWWWVMCNVSKDREQAVSETRAGLAAAGNHLARFTTEGKHIPPELLERIKELRRRYLVDYHFTVQADNKNAALVDELGLREYLADRFAIAGTPKDCIVKIEKLASLGVTQVWSSPSFHDKLAFLREWGEHVIPHFR